MMPSHPPSAGQQQAHDDDDDDKRRPYERPGHHQVQPPHLAASSSSTAHPSSSSSSNPLAGSLSFAGTSRPLSQHQRSIDTGARPQQAPATTSGLSQTYSSFGAANLASRPSEQYYGDLPGARAAPSLPSPSAAPSPARSASALSEAGSSRILPPPPFAPSPPSFGREPDPFRPPSRTAFDGTRRAHIPGGLHRPLPRHPLIPGMSTGAESSSAASTSSASPSLWNLQLGGSSSDASGASPASSVQHNQQQRMASAANQISPSYSLPNGIASHLRGLDPNPSSAADKDGTRTSMYSNAMTAQASGAESDGEARGLKRKTSPSEHERTMSGSDGGAVQDSPSRGGLDKPNNSGNGTPEGKNGEKSSGKRMKTARACDSCRRKKIRCDVIDDGGPPMTNVNNGNGGLICAHCRQYGFECTFFLPITETRFKKKREREAEEAAAAAAAAAGRMGLGMGMPSAYGLAHPGFTHAMLPSQLPAHYATAAVLPPLRQSASQEWAYHSAPQPRPTGAPLTFTTGVPVSNGGGQQASGGVAAVAAAAAAAASSATPPGQSSLSSRSTGLDKDQTRKGSDAWPPPDAPVLGPTSIAYIVHSSAYVPGAAIEAHDVKHNQTFEVGASGDGVIKFHKPPKQSAMAGSASAGDDEEEITIIPEAIKGRLAGDVVEKLVNTYFERTATMFPVITKSEFVHIQRPPPLLLYAICGVAALSREVPGEVLGAAKVTLNAIFRDNDFLSDSSSTTVRALLVLSLHSDLHGATAVQSGSRAWNRTGTAIRMAQDLGLHRDASGKDDVHDDAFFTESKRRVWGCCVTADRSLSIAMGRPLAIDLTDCDVRLPSPFEVLRSPDDLKSDPTTDRPFAFNTEMLKLCILFGRVMKTIYSPTGLMKATDEEITSLLGDMDRWKESLPAELQFRGADSSPPAGVLHVGYACLTMLFFRVFMRISYICPTHLSFSLTIERMTAMIRYSSESIDWVEKNDFYLDTMQFVTYCLVSCAAVQFHAYMRRGDQNALGRLRKLHQIMERQKDMDNLAETLSARRKTIDIIALLYESASGAYANSPYAGSLNPTAGVTNRNSQDPARSIMFRADASKPGGGVYVAVKRELMLKDLPKGTLILQETEDGNRIPALVRTSLDGNGGWQTFEQYRAALMASAKQGIAQAQAPNGNADTTFSAATGGVDASASTATNINGNVAMPEPPTIVFPDYQPPTGTAQEAPTGLAPPGSNLTYLGGDVWQDAEGRPVSRRGSRLVTMVPLSPGANGAAALGADAFSLPFGGTPGQLQVTRNTVLPGDPNFNFNPHLNDGYWAPAEFVLDSSGQLVGSGIGGFDTLMLDSIPGESLDFANWDAFFQKLNATPSGAPPQPQPTQQAQGQAQDSGQQQQQTANGGAGTSA